MYKRTIDWNFFAGPLFSTPDVSWSCVSDLRMPCRFPNKWFLILGGDFQELRRGLILILISCRFDVVPTRFLLFCTKKWIVRSGRGTIVVFFFHFVCIYIFFEGFFSFVTSNLEFLLLAFPKMAFLCYIGQSPRKYNFWGIWPT